MRRRARGRRHRARRRGRRSSPTAPACREADAIEAAAIKEVFGKRGTEVPVTVPKTMVGRLYAGGASLDVATALLAMRDGVIPPTINLDEPADGCDLNFVTGSARRPSWAPCWSPARGFGGFNSALGLAERLTRPSGVAPLGVRIDRRLAADPAPRDPARAGAGPRGTRVRR